MIVACRQHTAVPQEIGNRDFSQIEYKPVQVRVNIATFVLRAPAILHILSG
jgi:hypothetical protein